MAKLYTLGLKKEKRRKWDIIIALIVILAGFAIYFYITNNNQPKLLVDESLNQPQTKVFGASTKTTPVNEEEFRLQLPGEWDEWVEQGGHVPGQVYRYKALGISDNGRYFEVYLNSLLEDDDMHMTHVLPINSVDGGKSLQLDELSGRCREFAPIEEEQIVGTAEARWKDVEFDCNVHRQEHRVGTVNSEGGYQVSLGVGKTKNKYFFYYTDHGIQADNNVFIDILESFTAKKM